MLYGIDLSNWQEDLSIANISHEIDFAICKATEGLGYVDSTCDKFIQELKAYNKLFGFYHFARENSPEQEAQFFYDNCKNYFGHGIPVLDYETHNINDKDWVQRFCAKVFELSGIYPLVYCSASWIKNIANDWTATHCGLWCAGYPQSYTSFGDYDMPYDYSPWGIIAIWQFTSSLKLKGYYGNLDGNIAYMDEKAWLKYANATGTNNTNSSNQANSGNNNSSINITSEQAITKMAHDVIAGKYGNGQERKEKLYKTIQERVNELC